MTSPLAMSFGPPKRQRLTNGDFMIRLSIVALGALAASGCAGAHIAKPAVCDGKHRRPANPYGSILPSLPLPLPASQGGGGSPAAPSEAALAATPPAPASAPASVSGSGTDAVPLATESATAAIPTQRPSRRNVALSYRPC